MTFECPDSKAWLHGFPHDERSNWKFSPAASPDDEPAIPSPDMFDFLPAPDDKSAGSFRLPHRSECAAHLELLEALFALRQRVLRSEALDSVMGTEPVRVAKTGYNGDTKTFKDGWLGTRRQVKWPIFVEFAVVRFLAWCKPFSQAQAAKMRISLPPVDVIMVWHALMLNPRLFMEKFQDTPLHAASMPWQHIHEVIDSRVWTLEPSEGEATAFERATGLRSDLLGELSRWPTGPGDEPKQSRLGAFTLEEKDGESSSGREAVDSRVARRYAACFDGRLDRPFAVALRDAVIRQTSFVDKMHGLLWIRSPSLAGTLRRGIARYGNFLGLVKQYPGTMIVPTLDIDLAWHTHQCQGLQYATAMREHVGRFVNHDDTIAKDKLGDGFAKSSNYYRIQYGDEYKVCGCWDCETLLDAVEGMAGAAPEDVNMAEIARSAEKRLRYYRAVEMARVGEKPLPKFPMQQA